MNDSRTVGDLLAEITENMPAEQILSADIISSLSNAITIRRTDMGLSQDQLAKRIGKTQSTISKWENGDMNFTIQLLSEIAVKLNMDLSVKLSPPPVIQEKGKYRATSKTIMFDPKKIRTYSAKNYEELKEG